MIEFVIGLLVGALAMVPTVLMMRSQRDTAADRGVALDALNDELRDELRTTTLMAAAPTLTEKVSIAALLDRPDPEPEVAGRWLYSDDGLVSQFVPD